MSLEEQRRARFEEWITKRWPGAPVKAVRDLLPVNDPRYGEYVDPDLRIGWLAWNAALDSIEIELPLGASLLERTTGFKEPGDPELIQRILAVRAIEAAGVRIKP